MPNIWFDMRHNAEDCGNRRRFTHDYATFETVLDGGRRRRRKAEMRAAAGEQTPNPLSIIAISYIIH